MKLTKYKLKISIFISFIAFLIIFLTGSFFLSFYYIKENNKINHKINNIEKKIISWDNIQLLNIINQVNEQTLLDIVNSVIGTKNKTKNNFLKNTFGTRYVNIYTDNYLTYPGFDENLCNTELLCRKINKGNFLFVIGFPKNKFKLKKSLIDFIIFSFLISLLIFPAIYQIVSKITKPVETNFQFMKNFVNNAGHELKTPLANINLSAQILLNKKKFDENQIKQIESESARLCKLIDTLLQMSILSNFQNKNNLNLKQEIENIIKNYQKQIEEKNIHLKLNLQDIKKEINKSQFEILVNNLISNAIKYNKENGFINIILDNNKLIIENTGKEIPVNERKKIFNLFYRLEKNNNGYGLGLAIVKKIVDINKWKIKVKSKDGVNKFIINF